MKTPIPTQSPPILSPSPSPAPAKPLLAEDASPPLPREADALCGPKKSSSALPLKSPPSVASDGDGRNSKVNGKRKATEMMASSSAAQPVSSPDRNSKKGARLVTGDTVGSAAAEVAATEAKRESTDGGRSDPPGQTVSSSSGQKSTNNNSSSNGQIATPKGKSKIANSGGVGGMNLGGSGSGEGGTGAGNMPPPPYVFPVMVVEALLALSDSRGTSQLATLNWLKASRYRPLAMMDEAKFKANVAAGIKQASGGIDCLRVIMVTEVSPM